MPTISPAATTLHESPVVVPRAVTEARILGRSAVIGPPLILATIAFIGLIASEPARLMTAAIEAGVPLAAGLLAAGLLTTEAALELQLATPPGFRSAAVWRLALVFAWSAALSLVVASLARLVGLFDSWPGSQDVLHDTSIWLPPLLLFTGFGALLGVALRSRGAAAAAVTGLWIANLGFKDWFLSHDTTKLVFPDLMTFAPHDAVWAANRLIVGGIGLAFLALAVAWLGRGEWLLGTEDR